LKNLQSSHFQDFRKNFRAKLEKIFLVPADTFDNVTGQFPIAFMIWNSLENEIFKEIIADVYDRKGRFWKQKLILSYDGYVRLNKFLPIIKTGEESISYLSLGRNDFQNANLIFLTILEKNATNFYRNVTKNNLVDTSIYLAVQLCISANWLNDRDQFLFPENGWQYNAEFQNNCLAYTLFHGQNSITSADGVNHWIPFTETEVDAKEKFASNFMTQFIAGKIKIEQPQDIFNQGASVERGKLQFSNEAKAVFDAGRELWRYYHAQADANVNASLYDIKAYFQGRNEAGRMNNKSKDEKYNELIAALRMSLKVLALQIVPKVYEYGFLKK